MAGGCTGIPSFACASCYHAPVHACHAGQAPALAQTAHQPCPVPHLLVAPCSAYSGQPWSFGTCEFNDFDGWANAADAKLEAAGVDLSAYKYRCACCASTECQQHARGWCRGMLVSVLCMASQGLACLLYPLLTLLPRTASPCRVYLLPPSQCGWLGLGYVGCDGSFTCRAWIHADAWTSPQALMHELGHNLYMGHATSLNADRTVNDYGDSTCVMVRRRGEGSLEHSVGAAAAQGFALALQTLQASCPATAHCARLLTCCCPPPLSPPRRATAATRAAPTRRTPGRWAGSTCSSWTAAA